MDRLLQSWIWSIAMIRKLKSGKYRLYSKKKDPKTGKSKNLGTFNTREEAEKHEKEVQYFKRRWQAKTHLRTRNGRDIQVFTFSSEDACNGYPILLSRLQSDLPPCLVDFLYPASWPAPPHAYLKPHHHAAGAIIRSLVPERLLEAANHHRLSDQHWGSNLFLCTSYPS